MTEHSYTEWAEVKAPTEHKNGLETRDCVNCGHREQREIDALKPSGSEPETTSPAFTLPNKKPGNRPDKDAPEGNNGTIILIVSLAAVGSIGIASAAVLIIRKKKK